VFFLVGFHVIFAGMYFKFSLRNNAATGKSEAYYRLVESYRDLNNRIQHRTIINVGFLATSVTPEQLNAVSRRLTDMYQLKHSLFEMSDPVVKELVTRLWSEIKTGNKLDLTLYDPVNRKVDIDTLKHSHVREIGAEWMCYNTWQELQLDKLLDEQGFTENEIKLAQTQVISRAVKPGSELATARWIIENSAITEITGFDIATINKDRLYRGALKLNKIQEALQNHLSIKTNELFDIEDKFVLLDLTNTYFEGQKRNSKLAQFGRSKEKRSDAKLVVLALVVNAFGFIKYSSIHEGNLTDSKSLLLIIDKLRINTHSHKPLVVIDAGIGTEENLTLLLQKGYHYLCVSRSKPQRIVYDTNRLTAIYTTASHATITLKTIKQSNLDGYLLEVHSNKKQLTEESMYKQFALRFEAELEKIKQALHTKGGVKKTSKVHERIGRAKEKYPSIQSLYKIEVEENKATQTVTNISWKFNDNKQHNKESNLGKYYLRTSLPFTDEVIVWRAYNTIREIESTFRCLKTDLDLRPIYHKNDESTIAHLNLGLLSYWLVNTIRQKLKQQGVNSSWQEIVRIANTQKVITTTGINTAGKEITVRKCSEPDAKLKDLQEKLKIKQRPFTKIISVVHKPKLITLQIKQQTILQI
jgi:Transposase DDE domain